MSQTEMRSTIRPLTTPGSSVHASSYTSNYSGGLDVMNGDGEPSVATRPPAYAHLLIDSIDRYKNPQLGSEAGDPIIPWVFGQPPKGNDFRIERNQALINGYFTRIAITQLQFTYAVPTVIEGVNDTLFIDDNGGPVGTALVTLTPGYYTPQELATEFQDAIRAANPAFVAFTVTLSTDNKLVVASNSATTFFFPSPYVLVVPGQSINTAKAWKLLGIGQTNSEAGTPAATQYLDRCPNLL
jgi:hypothetical protein